MKVQNTRWGRFLRVLRGQPSSCDHPDWNHFLIQRLQFHGGRCPYGHPTVKGTPSFMMECQGQHWIHTPDDTPVLGYVTRCDAWDAWQRGRACQCGGYCPECGGVRNGRDEGTWW